MLHDVTVSLLLFETAVHRERVIYVPSRQRGIIGLPSRLIKTENEIGRSSSLKVPFFFLVFSTFPSLMWLLGDGTHFIVHKSDLCLPLCR